MSLSRGWAATVLAINGLFMLVQGAYAQENWELKSSAQVGLGAWHLSDGAKDQPSRHFLLTPNANTKWPYSDAAPWYTLQSQLRVGTEGEWVLRSRGNQGYGGSLDELSYAHFISPALGVRAGVLDYRATWCREYDLDNPWVRESDPFCTARFTNLATASAPAMQVYATVEAGAYQVQGLAGLFRPLALGYERKEFSNLILPSSATVTKNQKRALSVNAVNKLTSTEWRVSWLGADQSLFDSTIFQFNNPAFFPSSQLKYHQSVNTYFAGVSWQLLPSLRSRLTHLSSQLQARCEFLNPAAGDAGPCGNQFSKSSTVWELGYQLGPADVLSLAASQYANRQTGGGQESLYEARNRTFALAWRRDWRQGWFSAVQLSRTKASVPYNRIPDEISYLPGDASAWGLGLRVGYQF